MRTETAPSYPISIFITGDAREAEKICQIQCDLVGLCVTVTPTNYIYTGSSQSGVIVGLINYPRFPAEASEIWATAEALGNLLRVCLDQESFTIQAPDKTVWFSWREADLAIADRNPTGGDVKQAPLRSNESGGGEANRTDNPAITPCNQTTP